MNINQLIQQNRTFLQRLSWLFAGEGVARVTRLLTAVILSRTLSPYEFGIAAIALASDELIRVVSRNGIGIKIIQANKEQLDRVCQGVYRINWCICLLLAGLQIAVAKPLAVYFDYPQLQAMLITLALVYCIYPLAAVQVYRVQRRQDMKVTASMYGTQVGLDNVITALLALTGFGVWSVIVPKIIVAPIWVYGYHRAEKWCFNRHADYMHFIEIWRFSRNVLLVEALKTMRGSVDRLLIGAVLGVEAVGWYFFAVNAGSGLSLALINAFGVLILPKLCQQTRGESDGALSAATASLRSERLLRGHYHQSLRVFLYCIAPIIVLQLALAPWYVPFVFGQHWAPAIPLLMILCGGMIFQGMIDVGTQVLRAHDQSALDLTIAIVFAIAYLAAILVGVQYDIQAVTISILCSQTFLAIAAYCAVLAHIKSVNADVKITTNNTTKNNNNGGIQC